MSAENIVFRKIKEISARDVRPRPAVSTGQLASELSLTREGIMPSLTYLKHLKLLNFSDQTCSAVSLTLLGCMVQRDN